MNYVGRNYKRASPVVAGLMNDHVEITAISEKLYEGYLRTDFNKDEGPLTTVADGGALLTDKFKRGWKGDKVIESKPLEDAVEEGMGIAQAKGVALYVPSSKRWYVEVKWHPDGWEPDEEPEPVMLEISD